jgi:hypothetical protein
MRENPMGIVSWTPAEHEIIRAGTISEAMVRLPHRTKAAIKSARKKLRLGAAHSRWTKAENRRLLKFRYEPNHKLARRFKNRTFEAVKHQKCVLGAAPPLVPWKTTELSRLERLYALAPRSVLLSTFPKRTWIAIIDQAETQGWRRIRKVATAYNEYREAVRSRAREDGISLGKLGAETSCGSYFLNSKVKTADLNKIARAVTFFGGRLVIDWQDE